MFNGLYKDYLISFLLFLLATTISVNAQKLTGTIHGKVTNKENSPVGFATVILKETNINTTTAADGFFSLQAPEGNYTLIISWLGSNKISREISIKADTKEEITELVIDDVTETSEVQILGKTEAQKVKEQGFQVNVIDIKSQYNTSSDINQVLNRTTGVRIREEGGLGSNFNFSLNGFSGNQVKFFLDGIPMDNFGSSLTLNNIPSNIAERIEVYKGVLPVSLGTDALGGAINIVTRSNPNYLDLSYSVGSFNTHRPAISAAYTNKNTGFTVRTNAFYNYSDNDYKVLVPIKDLATSSYDGSERWVRRFHDHYKSGTIQLEAGVTGKFYADKLLLGVIASGNHKDIQTGVVMEEVYGAITSKTKSFIPTLKYSKTNLLIKKLDLNLYSAYNFNSLKLIDTTARIYNWLGESIPRPSSSTSAVGGERSRTQNENKNREFLTTANFTYKINSWQTLALNYLISDFHRSSYDVENPDVYTNRFPSDLTKQVAGLAWNADIQNKWTTSVFGKFYNMTAIGSQLVDQFTANQRYEAVKFHYSSPGYGIASAYFINPSIQIKASYEHAYRLPESSEIFGDGVFVVYSVGLRPEKSDNANFGVRFSKVVAKDHKLSAEGGFIYRMTNDFIRVNQSVSGGNRTTENKGKVRTTGFEADLGYAYKNRFFASVNGTFQDIIDKQKFEKSSGFTGSQTKNITYDFRLPNLPYLFANAIAGYNVPVKSNTLSLSYNLNYVQKYYLVYAELGESAGNERYIIPKQTAHNISATYSLAKGKYNLSLECKNLTDNLLYDSFRLQKPGRSFALKVRYFISKS